MEPTNDLIVKGRNFLELGNFEDALACFEQALILNQNDPELWNFKAVSLRSLGRYEEALECFNKSLEIDPRDKHAS
jgi:Flp pilus assembly protein TadD